MKSACVFLVLLLATLCTADIWTSCGSSSDHFSIGTVTITPDPPVKGQNITVSATGTLNEQVPNGTVTLLVKYDTFITILKKTETLCQPEYGVDCPLPAGPYTRTISELIPASTPSGHYTANVVLNDQNNQEIACINLDLKF
eukprot:TRINITY_DN85_c0_g2_i1.p1 TRINITY_DN85_c0_g2~~TRINITY_DN85_c0_g2_i1.p1  ORF type:complete len:142 (-),score=23.97 TRINITY_DN85_c0_g2_i1:77-502(-)